ncbi:DMT family transporter [Solimicrobium silvestre]|uniref:EamA-like transporter family n=1 Tax=Solimicrobium silvestre TaxID=2099400 RepID=A0A2S9GV03_9BURK|nr:DMT family transporter [Solimicrobium silvestre]PRC91549.1 EamA-like transporter family [Solimicrobium silvestre]
MQSLWILVSSLLFALMGVCVKLASAFYTTSEIVMYRGIFGVFFLFLISRINHTSLKTRMPLRHFGRGLVGVIALWLWFYTIGKLPLAMANTLNYMSPIWIAAMLFAYNWWRGKSGFSWGLPSAIMLSFVGVILLLQPSMQPEQLPIAFISLGSGMLAALAYLQVRAMGLLGEPETRVVFYFSLTSAAAGAFAGLIDHDWHSHQLIGIVLLLLVGLLASTAQLAMTRAYRLGNPLLTANLSYSGIIFSSVLGVLIWHDKLSVLSWFGIAVIVVSGILATYIHTKLTSKLGLIK